MMTTYVGIGIAASIYSFGNGCWFVTLPLILGDYHGPETLAFTYGFTKMLMGIFMFISPQISGK